jgi:hypothetical protein
MESYEKIRATYRPPIINWLFIAESPPPADPNQISTRHFYRINTAEGDRLFVNTMKALYPEATELSEQGLRHHKPEWLRRFQSDNCYMIEALEKSIDHGTKTSERTKQLRAATPRLIERVRQLVSPQARILLIKSNPYHICSQPLREAGFNVINDGVLNYPGYWQEQAYQAKLASLMAKHGWKSPSTD